MDRRALVAIIAVAVVVVAVFLLMQGQPADGNDGPVTGDSVDIDDLSFRPGTLNTPLGTTVTWTNNESVDVSVVFDSGPYPSSGTMAPGHTYSVTFDTAGTFNYHCSLHPSMRGSVVVS